MKNSVKWALGLAAAAVPLFAAGAASATTVTYTTSGLFADGSNTSTLTNGDSITFTGITTPTSVNAPSFATLGQFTPTFGTGSDTFSENFTLTINDIAPIPTVASMTDVASVTGTLTASTNGNGSTVQVLFTSPVVFNDVDGSTVTYSIFSQQVGTAPPNSLQATVTTTAGGTVPGTPLPKPAIAGGGLLALLGLAGIRRRQLA